MTATWTHLTDRIDGEIVIVEPLTGRHERGLFAAVQHGEVWRYLTAFPNACENPARFQVWMQAAMAVAEEGREGVWAIIERLRASRSAAPAT